MTEDLWIGMIAGLGWGLFLGAPIGVYWFRRFVSELADDEEKPSS